MNEFLQSANLLETIVRVAEQNSETATELVSDLNDTQLNWKPGPEKWSIAQCLDHLAVASHEFDGYFSDALARGRRLVQAIVRHPPGGASGSIVGPALPDRKKKRSAAALVRTNCSAPKATALPTAIPIVAERCWRVVSACPRKTSGRMAKRIALRGAVSR